MPRLLDSYTRYPRAILWLLREGRASIGGLDEDSRPVFDAVVPAFYLVMRSTRVPPWGEIALFTKVFRLAILGD